MATTTADWIEELKSISVLELSERIKALEEEFGVSATAVAAAAPCRRRRRRRRRGRGGVEHRRRHHHRRGRQEDPGHQGRPRRHRPRPQGGQGARRRGAQARQGGHRARRGRQAQGRARGGRRERRGQVARGDSRPAVSRGAQPVAPLARWRRRAAVVRDALRRRAASTASPREREWRRSRCERLRSRRRARRGGAARRGVCGIWAKTPRSSRIRAPTRHGERRLSGLSGYALPTRQASAGGDRGRPAGPRRPLTPFPR